MKDYYFFSEKELDKGINCLVLTNRKQMDKMFGTTTRADTPDFSRELLLVMVMPATKRQMSLEYRPRFAKAGDHVEVYCDIDLKGHKLTYEYNPIAVAIIPRYEDVRKVNFYESRRMKLLESVTVSERL